MCIRDSYAIADRPVLGTTAAGQEILLGGFSGLFYEGMDDSGRLLSLGYADRRAVSCSYTRSTARARHCPQQ